jgi:hypothetical protein
VRSGREIDRALALVAAGHSDTVIARLTGIPRSTVREWRVAGVPGRNRGARPPRRPCPICHPGSTDLPAADYAYLLGLYLGDGCVSKGPRTYCLRFFLDAATQGSWSAVARHWRQSDRNNAHGRDSRTRVGVTSSPCTRTIGLASSRNTAPGGSINGRSPSSGGRRRSSRSIAGSSCEDSFTAMAAGSLRTTGASKASVTTSRTSRRTLRRSTARALTRWGLGGLAHAIGRLRSTERARLRFLTTSSGRSDSA